MITKRHVLDEAAQSVRRTFFVSIAGTVGMLVVVGATGAYGMPEIINTQALKGTVASWRAKLAPMVERVTPMIERATVLANEGVRRASTVMPAPESPMAQPAQSATPSAAPSLAPPPAPVVAPRQLSIAAPAPIVTTVWPSVPEAAPNVPVSNEIHAVPERASVSVTAEPPQPVEASAPVVPPKPVEVSKPAEPVKPVEVATPVDVPNAIETPKLVRVPMPHPKPPLTPAQQLNLQGKGYVDAERCLAQAIYFEARNQAARGQMAVAQVVMNRVFSPYYPKDVCSVVYQNAHRHLSCQFTFACDGQPEAIRERGAWGRAQRIARETLEAKIWLPEVAKSTHYHAGYVRPYWIRDMKTMVRYGTHIFYRPRNWGDGANEPGWGVVDSTKRGRHS